MTGITILTDVGLTDHRSLPWLVELNQNIFGFGETAHHLSLFFRTCDTVVLNLAMDDKQPVGFKVGFKVDTKVFESWRGGVLPSARRRGIASQLMRTQHTWCVQEGIQCIKTTTTNTNTAMLNLNARHGFKIVGTCLNRNQRLKVLQEKWLTD